VIVDSSALIAILAHEPERDGFVEAILHARPARISAAGYLETALVVDGYRDPVLSRRLDELLDRLGIEIADVDAAQVRVARQAYRDFGRGSGSPASLNFGDCFAYGLASTSGEPLLFRGDDFSHTDLQPCEPW
jgi:ribonuclease VapC